MAASVITDLRNRTQSFVLYFFFGYKDAARNTLSNMYTTLTSQLLDHLGDQGMGRVQALADNLRGQCCPQATMQQRIDLLLDLLCDAAALSTVHVVIDACDECIDFNAYGEQNYHHFFQKMASLDGRATNIRFFLTTADYNVLPRLDNGQVIRLSLLQYQSTVASEIEKHVRAKIFGMGDAAIAAMNEDDLGLAEKVVQRICESSDGLWLQAHTHVNAITRLQTVADIKDAVSNLQATPGALYQQILLRMANDNPELLKETAQHFADETSHANKSKKRKKSEKRKSRNKSLAHRMLTLMCQATYCLVVPEFVAMVTVRLSPEGKLDKQSIPWDPDSLLSLLGDFIQVDDRTKEVNIPYSSMEEFFQQAPEPGRQPGWWYVSELEAQQSLAQICAWFLGSKDFETPLSKDLKTPLIDNDRCTSADNPFRKFPGGLGLELRQDVEMIKLMTQRLKSFPGLEYCAINFPFHARRAAYLEYKDTKSLNWIRQTLRPLVNHWLTGNTDQSEGNFRSWQEIHAFFCCEMPEDYHCIDALRQSVMCASDVTPRKFSPYANERQYYVYPDIYVTQMCGNFDAVQEWSRERRVVDWMMSWDEEWQRTRFNRTMPDP
ncbi:hypothetical protein QBC47DRAFT_439753 [Echria macrotheca]|uniref:Nephrocystin 3-like N-terminal domain-containing protein n=1 Tax=Echria macrotheca TaxID=438768 RepID=A0AAJ0B131_9PEZI|nr:hypothetical protein QBC47DRAFT_439753 [Echria macrotheca]